MEKKAPPVSVRKVFKELRKMIQNGVNVQEPSSSKVRAALDKDFMGYVLITCAEPSDKGKMQIELSFGGDEALASYLVDSAKVFFEEKEEE